MKKRFVPGLLIGSSASAIAWAAGANTAWTVLIGVVMALLVWAGPAALVWIADVIDDLT